MSRNISEDGKRKRKQASKRARRRRKRSKFFLFILLLLLVLATVVTLSLTVFFGISEIRVEGDFSAEEILSVVSVKEGDNLFLTSDETIREEILNGFADADAAQVEKKLPGTVVIRVSRAIPAMAFLQGSSYSIVSRRGRVLQTGASELPEEVVRIEGIDLPKDCKEGTFLNSVDNEAFSAALTIYEKLTENGVTNINCIRVSDLFDMEAVVDHRLLVRLGSAVELEYKLRFAAEVIQTQITAEETGTVDASTAGKVNFIPLREGQVIE